MLEKAYKLSFPQEMIVEDDKPPKLLEKIHKCAKMMTLKAYFRQGKVVSEKVRNP